MKENLQNPCFVSAWIKPWFEVRQWNYNLLSFKSNSNTLLTLQSELFTVGQVTGKSQHSLPNPTLPLTLPYLMTLEISVEMTKVVACELAFASHFSKHLFKRDYFLGEFHVSSNLDFSSWVLFMILRFRS